MPHVKRIEAMHDELIALRRDLHAHPELGFAEFYTADVVANYLRASGYEVSVGVGGTGVVGLLRGAKPGRTFALRACLDALEIQEQTGVAYASTNPGRMHACGHDGNMTVTLGAAKMLAEQKETLAGNVKVILQPSEENTGGAAAMIAAGVLDHPRVDAMITPHIWHGIPQGKFAVVAGPVMASSDLFEITLTGRAGHGAWPHLAVDPLPVAAELILALQTVISRNVDPMTPASLSLGQCVYGTAANIISPAVTLAGTVRTFDEKARDVIENRIRAITDGVAKAGQCTYDLHYDRVMPPLVNDPELAALADTVLRHTLGNNVVTNAYEVNMGCEEFSVYLEHLPGLFLFMGSSELGEPIVEIHNPNFLFPEATIPLGVRALVEITRHYLAQSEA